MRADKISKKNRMAHGSGGSSASRAQTTKGRSRYEQADEIGQQVIHEENFVSQGKPPIGSKTFTINRKKGKQSDVYMSGGHGSVSAAGVTTKLSERDSDPSKLHVYSSGSLKMMRPRTSGQYMG